MSKAKTRKTLEHAALAAVLAVGLSLIVLVLLDWPVGFLGVSQAWR